MRTSLVLVFLAGCTVELGSEDFAAVDTVGADLVAGRVAREFDVVGYRCPAGGPTCGTEAEQCICQVELDHVNHLRVREDESIEGHYLVMGSDTRRAEIEAVGNRLAVNINALNERWEDGGVARADAMMDWARRQFPGGVPEWFFLNEISRGRWNDGTELGASYRRFVGDVVQRLAVHHGRKVVVFSPFWRPGWDGSHRYAGAWGRIAEHGFVGVESYLSGAAIAANGFSESWCRSRYQQSIDAYRGLGVPLSRLMLTEHFGATPRGTAWGRAGVSNASWLRAIRVRTRAARSLPFAGYVTYAYSWNRAHRPSAERTAAIDAYHRVGARRLVFPDASHVARGAGEDGAPYAPGAEAEPEHEPADVDPGPAPPEDVYTEGGDPAADGSATDDGSGAADGSETGDGSGTSDPSGADTGDPPPPPPEPEPICEPRTCGAEYNDWCGGAPDGCGATLSCGDTCGPALNCTRTGVCKKALAQPCAGPGQCASGYCQWTTNPGTAARCCHQVDQWCDSDLKCCGDAVCRSGRCRAP